MILSELFKGCPGKIDVHGDGNIEITNLYIDSRIVTEDSLFFCIEGLGQDSHIYAGKACENGAKAVVIRKDVDVPDGVTKVFVEDTRIAMSVAAKNFYGNKIDNIDLIGITGTNGKTSMSYYIKSVLEKAKHKVGLIGTVVNMLGEERFKSKGTSPEPIELHKEFGKMIDKGADTIVMEVSSHSLALNRVYGCKFNYGIFTNLTHDHLDFHKTMGAYRRAKEKLFHASDVSIINVDDLVGENIYNDLKGKKISYGIYNNADVYARDIEISSKNLTFNLCYKDIKFELETNSLGGLFTVYNMMAAAALALDMGIDIETIKEGLKTTVVPGRMEKLDTDTDYSVILDYAHTPDALNNILKAAREFCEERVIILFGCGGERDKAKRPEMGEIAAQGAEFCIITSDNPRNEEPDAIIDEIIVGTEKIGGNYIRITDRREAIKYGLMNAKKGDVLILAGKGHEDYQVLKGHKKIDFDEKIIVKELLEEINEG